MLPKIRAPFLPALTAALVLSACSGLQPHPVSPGHIQVDEKPAPRSDIPSPVAATPTLQRPKAAAKSESYSVSVRNIQVQELLFALARDAKLNVDIHPGINGVVTLNAIDQTLQQILTRISKQVDMRWELDGSNLAVMPDAPYLRTYRVDYVNMSRELTGSVSINTQIASTSTSAAGTATSGAGNSSSTSVASKGKNDFWVTLKSTLEGILNDQDRMKLERKCEDDAKQSLDAAESSSSSQKALAVVPAAGPTTAVSGPGQSSSQSQGTRSAQGSISCGQYSYKTEVITNPEVGIVVVRATSRLHEKVQEYLDLVSANSSRQVIIEATIAEVSLSDQYKQGINWQSLRTLRPGASTAGFSVAQNQSGVPVPNPFTTATATGAFSFLLNYVSPGLGISSTLSLLETFGNVKVLSSPKISVLNNQTAMLKVVDNIVYFIVKNDTTTTTTGTTSNFTSTPQSVSVGLVMSVTPQISDSGMILLNVRPSISSLKGAGKTDPTPGLAVANVIPEIQTREMESMLRLSDGEVAVMGGLMEDRVNYNTSAVPGLGNIPGIGNFFRNRDDTSTKTELVIFLKPTIIRNPSLNGDYRDFAGSLPGKDFLQRSKSATSVNDMDARP